VFARVARYEVAEERMEEAVEAFRDAASQLSGEEGLEGGYILTDGEGSSVISLTFWSTRAARDASEVQAARLRREAAQRVNGAVTSVQNLEVAVEIAAAASSGGSTAGTGVESSSKSERRKRWRLECCSRFLAEPRSSTRR